MRRQRFPLIPQRHHRAAFLAMAIGGLIGLTGAIFNGDVWIGAAFVGLTAFGVFRAVASRVE